MSPQRLTITTAIALGIFAGWACGDAVPEMFGDASADAGLRTPARVTVECEAETSEVVTMPTDEEIEYRAYYAVLPLTAGAVPGRVSADSCDWRDLSNGGMWGESGCSAGAECVGRRYLDPLPCSPIPVNRITYDAERVIVFCGLLSFNQDGTHRSGAIDYYSATISVD